MTNGGFADTGAPEPFQWRLYQNAGVVPEIATDDLRPSNPALRVEYDGYATGIIVEQLMFLRQGSHRFAGEVRTELGNPTPRLAWTFSCANGGAAFAAVAAGSSGADPAAWSSLSGRVDVPGNCPAQWLRLETRAQDRRSPIVVWLDNVAVSPASSSSEGRSVAAR